MIKATHLLVIDPKTKICSRYAGRTVTHEFQIETDITQEKVEAMLLRPNQTGEPEEPRRA